MAEVANAFVTLMPSAKGFGGKVQRELGPDLDRAGRQGGQRFGKVFAATSITPIRALGGAALALFAGAKIAGFFKDSIAEARESQKVTALTAQVIKTTGGAAKITAGQVGDLATAISNKTGIDDEAIQSASNLLLTFKNVRNEVGKNNDVFNQATQIATDMGAALGKEPKAAAIQLGKALNDPVKGITALSRVGVSFTAGQKEQIKTMVKSGNTLGAQKIILGELKSEFGGAAAASATAGDKFKTTFANFKESVGTALLPILDAALGGLSRVFAFLTTQVGPAFSRFGTFLAPAVAAVQGFIAGLSGGGAGGGITGVLTTISTTVTTLLLPALQRFGTYILANVVPILRSLGTIVTTAIIPGFLAVATFIYGRLYPALIAIVVAVASRLKPVFDQLIATIKSSVIPTITLVTAKFKAWWPAIKTVILFLVSVIGWVLKLAASILGKVLPVIIRFAGFLLVNVVKAIIAVIEFIAKIVQKLIAFGTAVVHAVQKVAEFERGIREKIRAVLTYFTELPGKILSSIGNLGGILKDAGRQIIQGLLDGITEKFHAVQAKLGELTSKLPDWKGPATVDARILRPSGQLVVDGFISGLEDKYGDVQASLSGLTGSLPRTARTAGASTSTAPGATAAGLNIGTVIVKDVDEMGRRLTAEWRTATVVTDLRAALVG